MTESHAFIALVGDLFFESRLVPIAGRTGARLQLVRTLEQLQDALELETPALVLINLSMRRPEPVEAIANAKARTRAPVIAFGPHKDVEARRQALAAGADRWLPNSKLLTELPVLLSKAFVGQAIPQSSSVFDDE